MTTISLRIEDSDPRAGEIEVDLATAPLPGDILMIPALKAGEPMPSWIRGVPDVLALLGEQGPVRIGERLLTEGEVVYVGRFSSRSVDPRLLLRIATDLQKECNRTSNALIQADLENQIEGLKALYSELTAYRAVRLP